MTNALVVKMRPFYGHIEPPDHDVRTCTVTGVAWEGSHQTFFTGRLDVPIRFGDLGEFDRVIFWARGRDFVTWAENTLVFAAAVKAYGYVGIDRSESTTERHRRATIEAEFCIAGTPLD